MAQVPALDGKGGAAGILALEMGAHRREGGEDALHGTPADGGVAV